MGVSDWISPEEPLDESDVSVGESAADTGELEKLVASVAYEDRGGLSGHLFDRGGERWRDSGDRPRLVGECFEAREDPSASCRR